MGQIRRWSRPPASGQLALRAAFFAADFPAVFFDAAFFVDAFAAFLACFFGLSSGGAAVMSSDSVASPRALFAASTLR
jgi:hypothetical protein